TAQSARSGAVGYALKLPWRLFSREGRALVAEPLKNAKILADWTRPTVRERFLAVVFSRTPRSLGASRWRSAASTMLASARQGFGMLKDFVIEWPWSLVGRQWSNSLQGRALFWGLTTADLALLGYGLSSAASDRAQGLVMDWVYANPEGYEDLLSAV